MHPVYLKPVDLCSRVADIHSTNVTSPKKGLSKGKDVPTLPKTICKDNLKVYRLS